VFQLVEYGVTRSSAPRLAPSNWNCTPTTPTLSLAFAETLIVPKTMAPLVGEVIDTVGGVVSPPLAPLIRAWGNAEGMYAQGVQAAPVQMSRHPLPPMPLTVAVPRVFHVPP
jgi:hypothetical protein